MTITTMSVEERRNMSAAAMRTYPNIVRDWQLKEHDAAPCCWACLMPPIAAGNGRPTRRGWIRVRWSGCR